MRWGRFYGRGYTCIDKLICEGRTIVQGGSGLAQAWGRSCGNIRPKGSLQRGLFQIVAIELLGPQKTLHVKASIYLVPCAYMQNAIHASG
jgi:hypothetical protein